MKFVKNYAYTFVMGVAFGQAGWDFMTWQFYLAIIPIIILVEWKAKI